MQVLFLAANPEVSRLRLDADSREIQQAFLMGTQRDRFALHTRTDVRWRDLRQAILEVRPTILQFSGHGRAGNLVLTDDVGGVAQDVPLTALKVLLEGGLGVSVLVLGACNTAEYAGMFLGVVEHVIAMRGAISDEGASLFAQGFYGALACGHEIDTAFAVGKAELAARSTDPGDVDRPVHLCRPGARRDIGAEPTPDHDPMVALLRAITTQRNVFPLLPRGLSDQLADAFPQINDVINIISQADVLIQQAGAAIREPYRGYRLKIGRVPLQAGAHHAWNSAVRDSAALSPYALMAILLIAREQQPMLATVSIAIETVRNLRS